MKEYPILMSPPMMEANLALLKTETRRIVNPQPIPEYFTVGGEPKHQIRCEESEANKITFLRSPKTGRAVFIADAAKIYNNSGSPYGQKGDLLWFKETFYAFGKWVKNGTTKTGKQKWKFEKLLDSVCFDKPKDLKKNRSREEGWYKRPSLFMEKKDARLWAKVDDTLIERLHDITEASAIAEGVKCYEKGESYFDYQLKSFNCATAKGSYFSLWESINGENSWQANPFVWVVKYRIISPQRQTIQ